MTEQTLHNLFINNVDLQKSFLNILEIDEDYEFVSEDQYPNGIYADFTIKKGNEVKAIVELKGSNIGVSDFVRGIGQVLQYQHFSNEKMSLKSYDFSDAAAILVFPSSIVQNKNFNLGLFQYPRGSKIIEVNDHNLNLREITIKELNELATAINNDLVAISQYYIRDNRLFELYLCLKYLQILKIQGYKKVDRKEAEKDFLMKLETPNNRNWRNAFISLSSLNLIDRNNLPTIVGARYANMSYEEFAYEMYNSYVSPYIDLMTTILLDYGQINEEIEISYKDITENTSFMYNDRHVLYFTESKNRYLSSWLNIMRDDFGCVEFEPRQNKRKVIYNIKELNKSTILENIKNRSTAYEYIDKFNAIFRKGN